MKMRCLDCGGQATCQDCGQSDPERLVRTEEQPGEAIEWASLPVSVKESVQDERRRRLAKEVSE